MNARVVELLVSCSNIDHPTKKSHLSPLGGADADKQNSSTQLACVCLSLSHLTAIHLTKEWEIYTIVNSNCPFALYN